MSLKFHILILIINEYFFNNKQRSIKLFVDKFENLSAEKSHFMSLKNRFFVYKDSHMRGIFSLLEKAKHFDIVDGVQNYMAIENKFRNFDPYLIADSILNTILVDNTKDSNNQIEN